MAEDPSLYLLGSKKQHINSRQQPILQDCISQLGFPLNSSALTLRRFKKQTFPKEQITQPFPSQLLPHPAAASLLHRITQLSSKLQKGNLPHQLLVSGPGCAVLQNGSQKQKNPKEQGARCPHMPIPAASIKGELLPQSMKPVQLINSGANCWLQMY